MHTNDTNAIRMSVKARGFTLIELLVTLAVFAALIGFSSLSLFEFRRAQDLQFDAERIVAVLRQAQQNSILQEEDRVWGVCFWNSPQSASYLELFQADAWQSGSCAGTGFSVTARYSLKSFFTGTDQVVTFERITGVSLVPTTSIGLAKSRGGSQEKVILVYTNGKIEAQ